MPGDHRSRDGARPRRDRRGPRADLNRIFLHAKLAAYRTYVLGLALPAGASDGGGGLYWDMSAPYHYIRNQTIDGRSTLIVGGEDHKVGDGGDTIARFDRLEAYVRHHFHRDAAATDHRWSGQIVRSADGLPYVGQRACGCLRRHRLRRQRHHAGDSGRRSSGAIRARATTATPSCSTRPGSPSLSARAVARRTSTTRSTHRRSAAPPSRGARRGPARGARVLSLAGQRAAHHRNANGRRRCRPCARTSAASSTEHDRAELGLPLPRQPPIRTVILTGGHGAGGDAVAARGARTSRRPRTAGAAGLE